MKHYKKIILIIYAIASDFEVEHPIFEIKDNIISWKELKDAKIKDL